MELYESTLVTINNATITGGSNYAGNRNVTDGTGGVILFTRNDANFANALIPSGEVSITAIISVFDTPQLLLNSANDVTGGSGGGDTDRMSIRELRNIYLNGTATGPANHIEGVVISDNQSGNVTARNLYLQDGDAGIVVRFTDNHSFPIGSRLKIEIQGVEISQFRGLLQLNNVAVGLVTNRGNASLPDPAQVTVSQLLANMEQFEATRIRISMATISGGATYSGGRTVDDGTGEVILFTNSNANFANSPLPQGEVDVTAIASVFDNPQLIINGTSDVSGGGGSDPERISIRNLRNIFNGGGNAGPNSFIEGVVISDNSTGNINARNLFIQDETAGILVRFTANHSFTIGTRLRVDANGVELSEFRGLLQLNNTPLNDASAIGTASLPDPVVVTIAEYQNNQEQYESRRIRLENVTIQSGTFGGNKDVTDNTGTILMFTNNNANFANTQVPGGPVNINAIASVFDEAQIVINSPQDID
jgi:hypothetical protein